MTNFSTLWKLCRIFALLLALVTNSVNAQSIQDWFPGNTGPNHTGGPCNVPGILWNLPATVEPSADSWKLIFEDDFDGSTLDRNKWETKYPYPSPDDRARPNEGPCIYLDDNIVLNQGTANVQVRHEPSAISYPSSNPVLTSQYTGGILITKDAIRFNKGRFEIRCKFPVGNTSSYTPSALDNWRPNRWIGRPLWPAFWLIGGECGTEEIDIFEVVDTRASDHGRVFETLHGIAGGYINPSTNVYCENCIGRTPSSLNTVDGVGLADGNFHVLALEWEPACITWYVDGVPKKVHYRFTTYGGQLAGCSVAKGYNWEHPVWPVHDLQMIISMGMGDEIPDGTINFTGPNNAASLEVDYVRVYQRIPADDPKNLCSGTITGDKVVCSGDSYTATFRRPITGINWTCSNNLTLSSTTGATVTVSPASSGLSEQGWIKAEPVFQNGATCTAADATVTKQVWIGLPTTYPNLFAAITTISNCDRFAGCINLPGAELMGATYSWSYTRPAGQRQAPSPGDSTKAQAKEGPVIDPGGPIGPGGCNGCPLTSSNQCIYGDWKDYPGATARVAYSFSVSNRCGTMTVSGDIFRPYSTSNPCPPPSNNPPQQPKEQPSKLKFYPNPANTTLSVIAEADNTGQLNLCNAYGEVVFTATLGTEELRIDTSKLLEGVYILKVVGSDFTTTDRVLIRHE